ncbi:MAG: hypothetical protein L0Y56_03380 [Nitrospira sp.]|nr:hypothetical protein [Nitrospira sp.]
MKILNLLFGSALIGLMACWFTSDIEAAVGKKAMKSARLEQSYVWYDGDREQKVWLNPNLLAEFNPPASSQSPLKKAYPGAKALNIRHKGIRLWQLENGTTTVEAIVRSLKTHYPADKYSPVLHDAPTASSRMRSLPGNIIVYLNPAWDEATVHRWVNGRNLEIIKRLKIGPNIFVLKTGPGLEALETANTLYKSGEVIAAFPDWWEEAVPH